jgi:hypothetical protein
MSRILEEWLNERQSNVRISAVEEINFGTEILETRRG